MSELITVTDLKKGFKGREVIKGLNFSINTGEVVALVGPNGAGKSTTIAMLLGILNTDSGTVKRWTEDYKSQVGVQLQSTPFFEGYSAEENLEFFAALYKVKLSKNELDNILKGCGLLEVKKTPAIRLSIGQQKRLAIAVTTIHHPKLIILDEPTAGLDPKARQEIRKLIKDFATNQTSVMFSSHDMEEVEKVADKLLFLYDGKIAAEGKPDELIAKYSVSNLEELYMSVISEGGHDNE